MSSKSDFQAVVTHKNYKMIWGQEFLLDRAQHLQSDNVQLYDIDKDPEERNNIQHLNDEVRGQYVQFTYSTFQYFL